jgi:prepilin peptidase CpaA
VPVTLHLALLGAGIAVLLAAAAHDVLARTIPDRATAFVAASGLALRVEDGCVLPALAAALPVLAVCFVFWRASWLGGGDVKLLGAVALLLPPDQFPGVIVATSVAGTLLAVPYIVARGRIGRPAAGCRALSLPQRAWRAELFRLRQGGPLPYGAAIAAGVLFNLLGPGR